MSGETETPKAAKGWKRILGIFTRIILICFILLILLGFSVRNIWPWQFALHLIVGPFIHAWKNLPPFLVQWRSSLLPLACLVVSVVLAHRFIRWWITSKNISMSWRWGHTTAAALLILLGSAAAIAMSGITHQAAWLFSSPWLESNRLPYQTVAVSNARQIVLALIEYEYEHGRYPDTLDEAAKFSKLPSQMLWVKTGPDGLREPFIFLKPGRPSSGLIEPILVSPAFQTDDRVVVGISDCSVKTMTHKALHKLTEKPQTVHE